MGGFAKQRLARRIPKRRLGTTGGRRLGTTGGRRLGTTEVRFEFACKRPRFGFWARGGDGLFLRGAGDPEDDGAHNRQGEDNL